MKYIYTSSKVLNNNCQLSAPTEFFSRTVTHKINMRLNIVTKESIKTTLPCLLCSSVVSAPDPIS